MNRRRWKRTLREGRIDFGWTSSSAALLRKGPWGGGRSGDWISILSFLAAEAGTSNAKGSTPFFPCR